MQAAGDPRPASCRRGLTPYVRSLLLKLRSIAVTSTSSCRGACWGCGWKPGMEARPRDIQSVAQPCHRPKYFRCFAMKANLMSASLAVAAAFFRMSRSAFSFAFLAAASQSPAAPASSDHGRGNACCGSIDRSAPAHLRSTFSWRSGHDRLGHPRRSVPSPTLTASSLNSRLNFLLCIPTLQFR